MSAEVPDPMFQPEFPGIDIESLVFLHDLNKEMHNSAVGPERALQEAESKMPDLYPQYLDGLVDEIVDDLRETVDDAPTPEGIRADEDEIARMGLDFDEYLKMDAVPESSADDLEDVDLSELDEETIYPPATLAADEELIAQIFEDFKKNSTLADDVRTYLSPGQQARAIERLRQQQQGDDSDEHPGANPED